MGDLTLTIPDDREHDGPAMSCLTPQQRAFVLTLGVIPPKEGRPDVARIAATLGCSDGTVRNYMRSPHVQAAIQEETGKRFGMAGQIAVMGIEKLAGDTTHKDHFGALKWIAAMAGMAPEQKVKVDHTGSVDVNLIPVDNRERVKRIAERLRALGRDPKPVLLAAGINLDVIDAEFEEVWEVDA